MDIIEHDLPWPDGSLRTPWVGLNSSRRVARGFSFHAVTNEDFGHRVVVYLLIPDMDEFREPVATIRWRAIVVGIGTDGGKLRWGCG